MTDSESIRNICRHASASQFLDVCWFSLFLTHYAMVQKISWSFPNSYSSWISSSVRLPLSSQSSFHSFCHWAALLGLTFFSDLGTCSLILLQFTCFPFLAQCLKSFAILSKAFQWLLFLCPSFLTSNSASVTQHISSDLFLLCLNWAILSSLVQWSRKEIP